MAVSKKDKTKETVVKKSVTKKKKAASMKADKVDKTPKASKKKAPGKKATGKSNEAGFVLDAVMVINNAKELHEKLKELSQSSGTITIDASKLEMIDTANLQLLLAFVSTMKSKNVALNWKDPSPEFLERASVLNLEDGLCLI